MINKIISGECDDYPEPNEKNIGEKVNIVQ